ncbi:hypothetical protein BRC93_08185 [Halobacteriales archaeon QS_5_70_15]|nr:MAG: hypothetical protein BRC93_08185 [Halobacteriales archaeon QS_5_70_15]
MGAFADAVNGRLREALAERRPRFEWEGEHPIAGTPVDVAGVPPDHLVAVELEWRRADPADNTAKLFRHLPEGPLDRERVSAFQGFTGYYDLASGGVSSKRRNAEFVGRVAADSFGELSYHPVEFEMIPPKRGGERPDEWREVADETAGHIAGSL